MQNLQVATMQPPPSPPNSEMIVKKKSINTVEITLGVTNFFVGSVPRARIASICSVTTIDPISLAIPEEFLPATINPVKTGPSSVTMPTDTNCPMRLSDTNLSSVCALFSASTAPVNVPVSTTIGREPTPIKSPCG